MARRPTVVQAVAVSNPTPAPSRRVVAIAGASGFVGRHLARSLAGRHEVLGLSRHPVAAAARGDTPGVQWRRCDMLSLLEIERALVGVDVAYYLVHSMLPSARLTQGTFENIDLIAADNFARAARDQGVERIIYLGGLVPDGQDVSGHLRSRLEVEKALGSRGVPVTALRAGLVVGPGGSSLRILVRLVQRLPLMVLPSWTETRTQPIALADALELLEHCLDAPEVLGKTFDIGGPEVLAYRELIEQTATVLGKPHRALRVPWISPRISKLWVSTVTGMPRALVGPLIESLRCEMVAGDLELQREIGQRPRPFQVALREALQSVEPSSSALVPRPRSAIVPKSVRNERLVRSVQRLPLPEGWDALDAAREYMRWLDAALRFFLRVEIDGPRCRFFVRLVPRPLLELTFSPERSRPDRALFYVTGGLLRRRDAPRRGRLEFRPTPDGRHILAAIHDFAPALPWFVYNLTQAIAHVWVMHRFGAHLAQRASSQRPPAELPARSSAHSPARS